MKNANTLDNYYKDFPTRLRELMKERNITQQTLAKEVGTTRQAISQYADGSVLPTIDKLYRISQFFEISSDYLLGITDVKTPEVNTQALNSLLGLSENTIDVLISDTEFLLDITGKKTISEALVSYKKMREYIRSGHSEKEILDYSKQLGYNPNFDTKVFNGDYLACLSCLSQFNPSFDIINTIIDDEPIDPQNCTILDALANVLNHHIQETPHHLFQIAEWNDNDEWVVLECNQPNGSITDDDIFNMRLLKLQQVFLRYKKEKDQKALELFTEKWKRAHKKQGGGQ